MVSDRVGECDFVRCEIDAQELLNCRELDSSWPIVSNKECSWPKDNNGNAGRYLIVCSFLVLHSRYFRRVT